MTRVVPAAARQTVRVTAAAAPAPSRPKNKVLKRASRPRPMRLENRDIKVLRALALHRFLSSDQLHRLVFRCSASMVRRRLRGLYDHKLIDRVAVLSQPTRGIPPYVYTLDNDGAAVLADLGDTAQPSRFDGQRLQHVRHKYLTNDFCITLTQACRNSSCTLADWRHENDLLQTTASDKRRAQQIKHPLLKKTMPFLPDGFFQLDLGKGEGRLSFFLEMDLASHALRVWRQRALLYAAYADPGHGLFRQRFGRENFRLLIVTTPDYRSRSRLTNILNTVHRELTNAKIPQESRLFLGTTLPEVTPEKVLGAIWRQSGQPKPISFLPNAGVRIKSAVSSNRVTVKNR